MLPHACQVFRVFTTYTAYKSTALIGNCTLTSCRGKSRKPRADRPSRANHPWHRRQRRAAGIGCCAAKRDLPRAPPRSPVRKPGDVLARARLKLPQPRYPALRHARLDTRRRADGQLFQSVPVNACKERVRLDGRSPARCEAQPRQRVAVQQARQQADRLGREVVREIKLAAADGGLNLRAAACGIVWSASNVCLDIDLNG